MGEQRYDPVIPLYLVLCQVYIRQCLRARPQMFQTLETRKEVLAERKSLQRPQMIQVLYHMYLVVGQIQDFELRTVNILDLRDHVIVQEQTLEKSQTLYVLDLLDEVVLKVEGFEVDVGLQVLDPGD